MRSTKKISSLRLGGCDERMKDNQKILLQRNCYPIDRRISPQEQEMERWTISLSRIEQWCEEYEVEKGRELDGTRLQTIREE